MLTIKLENKLMLLPYRIIEPLVYINTGNPIPKHNTQKMNVGKIKHLVRKNINCILT